MFSRGAALSGAIFWTGVRFLGYMPVCLGPPGGRSPLCLLSWPFFVGQAPGAFTRRVFWANALLLSWMNGWTRVNPRFRSEARRVFSVACRAPPGFFFGGNPVFQAVDRLFLRRIVASYPLRRLSCPLRSRVYVLDRRPSFPDGSLSRAADECDLPVASFRFRFRFLGRAPVA